MQMYSSKATSVNGKCGNLPAIYRKINFPPGTSVLDVGCGDDSCVRIIKQNLDNRIKWNGYDPYNQSDYNNNKSLNKEYDFCVCSNVLNVIDDESLIDIIKLMMSKANKSFVSIYEGKRDGIGRQTGVDQYQRNAKRSWYVDFINSLGFNATCKNSIITITN